VLKTYKRCKTDANDEAVKGVAGGKSVVKGLALNVEALTVTKSSTVN
jgi:hypothetical protein